MRPNHLDMSSQHSNFNINEFVELPDQETDLVIQETPVPDPSLSLWDVYPTLWQDASEPYVDPFEDSNLIEETNSSDTESFRLNMQARKKHLDTLFQRLCKKSLSYPSPPSWTPSPSIRVHSAFVPSLAKPITTFDDEKQAALDLLTVLSFYS